MKVLIIEDDLIMTLVLSRMLKSIGYSYVCAKDGREGLELIKAESPDIVITDMMLPFVSGSEIISFVKKLSGRRIPVILLSSLPLNALKSNHKNLNADSYLVKPVSLEELKFTIEELVAVEYA